MDYEKIKKLMDDMGNSKLTSIDIDFPDGTKVSMKKEIIQVLEKDVVSNEKIKNNTNLEAIKVNNEINLKSSEENLNYIKSPMVGTFYLKPSPTADPYVELGSKVKQGQTLCIIEAMKLMNEIESEFDGEIVDVLVKDGEPVEYGTKLFAIK